MALNDIKVPKENAQGTFNEIALAPADIGAASSTHASTHHTGGSDALTPFSIGADSRFVTTSLTVSASQTLAAGRAQIYILNVFSAATVTLPTTGVEIGDRLVIVGGSPVSATATLSSTGISDALTSQNQQFSYVYGNVGGVLRWIKNLVDTHTHAAADITSGTLNIGRIPTGTGSTQVALGNHTHALSAITDAGTAAAQDANQDLGTSDQVTFQGVTVNGPLVNEFYPGEGVVNCGKLNLDAYAVDLGGGVTGDGFPSIVFGALNGGITLKGPEGDITTSKVINIPNASGTLGLSEPSDSTFRIVGSSDATKKVAFEVDGLSAVTTRTLTVPDASGTLALTSLVGASAELVIACSDETSNLTTGTAKVTFRMPYAMTLSSVRASVNTAPTGSTLIVDINEGGSTILSTKLSIDASELTSTTAATAAVISDTALADDAEVTIDIDQIGSTIAGKGLKVVLKGVRA